MSVGIDMAGSSWALLTYTDVFGASHSMQLPAGRFAAAVENGQVFDGSSLEGRTRLIETDMRLRPDPATLVRLDGGLARVVCTVLASDGTPWPGDPRTALAMVVAGSGELGREYTVAAELEFYLLDASCRPIDAAGYFLEAEGVGVAVVRRAADRLISHGVGVDSSHHEAGPGQYEIDLAALPPVALADALILAKHVVREEAAADGLRATFMPRPLAGEAGSGLHLHQRVGTRLVSGAGVLKEEGRAFLAGQLAHARGLSALASPTVNSYKRLHSGPEAPSAVVWAHLNRGALVRLSPNTAGGATLEYRASDPSANPYLLLAGLLAAGGHGLRDRLELPAAVEEETSSFDPAAIDSAQAEMLPHDIDDALDALVADDVLVDAFDPRLVSELAAGRRAEAAAYRAQVTPWELERYLDDV